MYSDLSPDVQPKFGFEPMKFLKIKKLKEEGHTGLPRDTLRNSYNEYRD